MTELPNYRWPIDHAETISELDDVITRMLLKVELLDIKESRPQESYAELASYLEEEAEMFYNPDYAQDLNNVVYWLELAHQKLTHLLAE